MEDRYEGREDLVDINQVSDYIADNYVSESGDKLSHANAIALCQHDIAWEWIQSGVANRSFVYYVGDMIAERAGLNAIDDSDHFDDESS